MENDKALKTTEKGPIIILYVITWPYVMNQKMMEVLQFRMNSDYKV